jgi:hypothetical protein
VYSVRVFKLRCCSLKFELFCNKCPSLDTNVTFICICNISAYDVKCNGIYISGLAFVRGTLLDPAFGGLSGRYPTGQGIIPFEARGSPQERTHILEPV